MKLILGLGNPGRQYEATRHNVGWWVLDHLAGVWRFEPWRRDRDTFTAPGSVAGEQVRLVKPLTYMNLSGHALRDYLRREDWVPSRDLLVVVDDVALEVGSLRMRARGSAGGHNGLLSIENVLDSVDYARLRVGVGPSAERQGIYPDLADFVLAPFARDERDTILELMPRITAAAETWIAHGPERAMSLFNVRVRRAADGSDRHSDPEAG